MGSSKQFIEITCATCSVRSIKRSDFVDNALKNGRVLVCSKKCAAPHRKKSVYKVFSIEEYTGKHKTSVCKLCKLELPIESFFKGDSKRMKFRRSWFCDSCRAIRIKEYRLKKQYNMKSIDEYGQMLANQANKCAICLASMNRPCIDHNHETGKVRELLCVQCNAMIGNAHEDMNTLHSAIKYLQKHV